jgi:hypothetical protein
MKKQVLLTLGLIGVLTFTACSKEDSNPPEDNQNDSILVSNLHAPQDTDYTQNPPVASGPFVKFDFSTGAITTSETDWDIAFRGTSILVNGGSSSGIVDAPERNGNAGAYIVDGIFDEISSINTSAFAQDGPDGLAIPTGSGNGWYTYDGSQLTIRPIPGKVIVLRTADDKYAKVEILSYYKDAPEVITDQIALNDLRYYTFNYVYQDDAGAVGF